MCILRPGVPGLCENIRVISVVGRFLEHHRIYYFRNGGDEEVYLGSADLMPRNLDRRVEAVFPVEDEGWRTYLRDDVLGLYLRDTVRAHELQPDGSYVRLEPAPGHPAVDAQESLLAAASRPVISIIPVPGLPEVEPGLDLALAIVEALEAGRAGQPGWRGEEPAGRGSLDGRGDVLVVTSKIVSKAEGRLVELEGVVPERPGRQWARGAREGRPPRGGGATGDAAHRAHGPGGADRRDAARLYLRQRRRGRLQFRGAGSAPAAPA